AIRIRTSGSTSPDLNDGGCVEVHDDGGSRGRFEPELRTIQRFTTVDGGGSRQGEAGD
ncbi:hypothetical protein U1Q18_041525, partial [Sarracenia purpurea var. burkii]